MLSDRASKGTLIWDTGTVADAAWKPDGTALGLSHYHFDHTANANEFAGATWLVRQNERDTMFADKPPEVTEPSTYAALRKSKTLIITSDEYDMFGDGPSSSSRLQAIRRPPSLVCEVG